MIENSSRVRLIGPQEYGVISRFDLRGVDCLVTPKLEYPWFAAGFSAKAPHAPQALLVVCNLDAYNHNLDFFIAQVAEYRGEAADPVDMRLVTPCFSQIEDYSSKIPGLLGESIRHFKWIKGRPDRPTHGILRLERTLSAFRFINNERKDIQEAIKRSHLDLDDTDLTLRQTYAPFIGLTVYNGGNGQQASQISRFETTDGRG